MEEEHVMGSIFTPVNNEFPPMTPSDCQLPPMTPVAAALESIVFPGASSRARSTSFNVQGRTRGESDTFEALSNEDLDWGGLENKGNSGSSEIPPPPSQPKLVKPNKPRPLPPNFDGSSTEVADKAMTKEDDQQKKSQANLEKKSKKFAKKEVKLYPKKEVSKSSKKNQVRCEFKASESKNQYYHVKRELW